MIKESFDKLVNVLTKEVKRYYGNRIVSIALFGSVAREAYRSDSDIDILLIVERLPKGRTKRIAEFLKIEKRLENILNNLQRRGLFIEPPKFHDVGSLIIEHKDRFKGIFLRDLKKIAKISKELRKERELLSVGKSILYQLILYQLKSIIKMMRLRQ